MLYTIEHRVRKLVWMIRGALLTLYLRVHGCSVGRSLKCKQWPVFRQIPRDNITLGDAVTIGYRVTLDVMPGASLEIASHVNLTQDVLVSCASSVSIGEYSGIGEFSSVRDSEHGYSRSGIIHAQQGRSEPIHIGSDVQVSRGCTVLLGARLEDGSILGVNSVITAKTKTVEYGIYMGVPAKFIGMRIE